MKINSLLKIYLLLCCCAANSNAFAATVITFDSLEAPGSSAQIFAGPLDIGEFRFTSVGGGLAVWPSGSSFYNGSAALTSSNSSDILMTRIDGAAFGVTSVALDVLYGGTSAFELIGGLSGGGTVQQTFLGDGTLGNEIVVLTGFNDILSLNFGGVGVPNFANLGSVDNIALVPVPAAAWLFGSALLGLGWSRRKKT